MIERGICDASQSTIVRWRERTRSARGGTARGSSRLTLTSPRRPAGSLISMRDAGTASALSRATASSPPTRSPRSKPGGGSAKRGRPRRASGAVSASSTPMSAAARSRIWRHGTCAAAGCSAGPNARAGSPRLTAREPGDGHEPYASARRVFWIVDNGSSHRGQHPSADSNVAGRT